MNSNNYTSLVKLASGTISRFLRKILPSPVPESTLIDVEKQKWPELGEDTVTKLVRSKVLPNPVSEYKRKMQTQLSKLNIPELSKGAVKPEIPQVYTPLLPGFNNPATNPTLPRR